uniref:Uncharacterized protein n=1 Tax=Globodera rostochiensis TaxID=31243 RepID=A0A914GVJ4_GLORO
MSTTLSMETNNGDKRERGGGRPDGWRMKRHTRKKAEDGHPWRRGGGGAHGREVQDGFDVGGRSKWKRLEMR